MSDAYKNFGAVVDILEQNGVAVTATEHEHTYTGGGRVRFSLTVDVPAFEPAEYRHSEQSGD